MACPGPSLPGAFDLLAATGPDELVALRHKLQTVYRGRRGADLLHTMVLLQLGRGTEARISLDALKADTVARAVARQWAGVDSAEDPEEPADVSWAVARLYHLLAEESLCPATLRDAAYRAAHQALSSRGDPRLDELKAEARDRCGWDVLGDTGGFRPLCSREGPLPPSSVAPSGTRSLPRPIEDWSRARSLRSTDSPASLASDLEISQSPTMAVLGQPRGPPGPSKLGAQPPGDREPEEMSWPPSAEVRGPPELPGTPTPEVGLPDRPSGPEASAHYPVESADASSAPKSLPSPDREPTESLGRVQDQGAPHLSAEDAASEDTEPSPQTPETSPPCGSRAPPAASCPPGPSSLQAEASEQKFYSFVVLHALADELVALRVRERLEALGVPDGATFCEDFQVPGRGELRCLQDAIDHSGFVILLMTPNFDSALSLHQVNQALTSSFTHHGRRDSVVPFLPLESTPGLQRSDTSRLLSGLVWLDEHSRIFPRKVGNTFKPQRLWERRAHWQREQDVRARLEARQHLDGERQQAEALHAQHSAYLQSYLAWQVQMDQLKADFGSHLSLGTQVPHPAQRPFGVQGPWGTLPPFPGWPGCPQPPTLHSGHTGSPSPAFPQPPTFPPASSAPPQTPFIIHHAQMVQLGINNHMWNQRGTQAPEDEAQEVERLRDQA